MLRKVLSAALSLSMMCSLLPASSFAADKPLVTSGKSAVTVEAGKTLTRGQMAALLIEKAGLADQVKDYAGKTSVFTDVAEGSEYEGYINLAYEKGFVAGIGDKKFAPDVEISQVEAAAMVERLAEVPNSVLNKWPAAYDRTAISTGLSQATQYEAAAGATKEFVDQLFTNADGMEGKPFIGISWKKDDQDYTAFHQIIAKSGGIAVELPQLKDEAGGKQVAKEIDGAIVTGGQDVNPARYGEEQHPLSEDNNEFRDVRDNSDFSLWSGLLSQDVPALGICRGMQTLNVALGGGLIQDLPTYLGKDPDEYHTHRHTPEWARHGITVEENSRWLADIIGGMEMTDVASWHHQVLNPERLGKGVTVVAYGPDEVIEAIEVQDHTFLMGLQFHPEVDALGGEEAKGDVATALHFFETLVDFASDKPIIGVSWGGDPEDAMDLHKIIRKAGGVLTRMPEMTDLAKAQKAMDTIDGLVVTGGEDINPKLYGQEPDPLLEDNNEFRDIRDTSDFNLVKAAVEADKPMIGICRGMQMLNTVLKGQCIQDLPTYLGTNGDDYRVHRDKPNWARHDIELVKDAKLMNEIVDGSGLKDVASWHHQALDPEKLGENLIVGCYGPDEVIESIEMTNKEFILGVQFHPEHDALERNDLMNFFNVLVDYAD